MKQDRALDREHEQQLEEKRQEFEVNKEEHRQEFEERKILLESAAAARTECFNRRAQLMDLARQYRRSIAELDPRDSNSKRLRQFYESEGLIVQDEIKEVDKEIDESYRPLLNP